MNILTRPVPVDRSDTPLRGTVPHSPAGPVETLDGLLTPPAIRLPRTAQNLWYGHRQVSFAFRYQRYLGDVFATRVYLRGQVLAISHPDHVRSLFTAPPALVPSIGEESPVRPPLGPGSLLTTNGERHLRDRKLLLPPFHGEAIARYETMIAEAAQREIARWPVGEPFALAGPMQAITLDVIMTAVLGIEGRPRPGTLEHALRAAIKALLHASSLPGFRLAELMNLGHEEPFGITWAALLVPDRLIYRIIRKRRRDSGLEGRGDILSLIIRARTEDGEAFSDRDVRDQLMTLVLAGHETTANQLAWTWERLVRHPDALARLTDAVRGEDLNHAADLVEATLTEGMRSRPVVPMIGRRPSVPWRFGDFGVPAGTGAAISILLLHHREDLYPDPFAFRPERWLDAEATTPRRFVRPGTYEWIAFGGGTRRCLGATLAMAEQRVVLREMVRRLDIQTTNAPGERPIHRNVTMLPHRGGRITIKGRR